MSRLASLKMTHIAAIIIVVILVVIAATQLLGGDDEGDDGPTTISFHIFGGVEEKAAYEMLVAAFEERFPDIDVRVVHTPGQGDYRQRLAQDFAAGTPSDIFFMNYRRFGEWASQGVLEPLGPYVAESDLIVLADFYEQTVMPFYWSGQLMCVPQNLSSLVVYYNKSLFDEYDVAYPENDWTWDDFLDKALALTDPENDIYGVGIDPSIFRVAPFIWQNGGELVDSNWRPRGLQLDTPEAREAMQWFIDLQMVHGVVPDRDAEAAMESEDRFQAGRMGMIFNSRRGVPAYRAIEGFEWDAVPLPTAPGGEFYTILHSDGYCMYEGTKNKDAAWTFIEFANSHEGQSLVVTSGRTVPSLRSVAESEAFLDGLPPLNARAAYLDTIPSIKRVPTMATWVEIEEIFSDELERAFYDGVSLDEILESGTALTRPSFLGAEE